MSDRFRYYLRVRYGECDAQKVVFNARYGDYIDLATSEFLRALGYADVVVQGPFDYQLVKQTLEWKLPARFDEVLEISMAAKHLGNTSFTLQAEFRIAGSPHLIFTAETIYVLIDAKTFEKSSLPQDFRAALQSGAVGLVTDHAGYLPSK